MGAQQEYATGEVIANKYVVEGLLGESPSGRTYLAASGMGSQKLCVKIFRTDVSTRLLSAPDFFLKAGVATEIEHDNLGVCLDVQEEMGSVFTARAHIEGQDFEEWIRKNRREGNFFTRGLELLWQACQGLSALHERTRHLNIHPGNMLVTPLMAKLCDWDPRSLGSMEMTPEPLPFRSQYAGYRAPEMASRGSFLSYPSSDLFAVAGLLYRLVMEEHPESDLGKVAAGIRTLDQELGRFLGKALHPRPEERFQEASSFSDALWDLQGSMQRLQERQPKSVPGRQAETARTADPAPSRVAPAVRREEPRYSKPAEPTPPTMAMDAKEPTLFGEAPAKPIKDDSFFNFFPADAAPAQPSPPPTRKQPPPGNETFFGSRSAENPPASGGTFFGEAPPPQKAPARPASHGSGMGGLEGLEGPGTLFGSEPPPTAPSRKPPARKEPPKPVVETLSSLEKDPLEAANDKGPGGFTQFGFKGAGDNRTLYSEGGGMSPQRKLAIALAAVGALVLLLALGGLFVFLRSSAAPEEASHAGPVLEEPDQAEAPQPDPQPALDATPATGSSPTADAPPYSQNEIADQPDPAPIAAKPAPKPPEPKPEPKPDPAPMASSKSSAKGSPERLAQLTAMVAARSWPASAAERLKAADELNDFGKVAEANVVYGRTMLAADVNDKQKISALGGLAATFNAMGMKDQALDAVNQILEINPRNSFALRFKEKLK